MPSILAGLDTTPDVDPKSPVLVIDGDTVKVRVDRGHLQIDYGNKQQPRSLRLVRAYTRGKRILILAWHGIITLDAAQWCQALSIELVLFDPRQQDVILYGGIMHDDARLRRVQAMAPTNDDGVHVARWLLGRKLVGQRDILRRLGYVIPAVEEACELIEEAPGQGPGTIEACIGLEAQVAAIYWDCFAPVECRFAESDRRIVSEHWMTAGPRYSPRTKSTKMAITPMHAILNYLYKLAEVETTIALRAVGLDPGLGILHTDKRNRDSMTLDCLEAIRPQIDTYALDLLDTRVFTRHDFFERADGTCRLLPPFSHELSLTLPRWRKLIAPVAEQVANMLRPANTLGTRRDRTPLTKQTAGQTRSRVTATKRMPIGVIGERHRSMQLPTTAGGQHREQWLTDLYPAVRITSTARLAAATGLTTRYMRAVKRGTYVPDPRHWPAIRHVIDSGP